MHVQKANRQEPAGRKIKIYNLAFVLKMLPHFDKTFLRRECGGASVVGVYSGWQQGNSMILLQNLFRTLDKRNFSHYILFM